MSRVLIREATQAGSIGAEAIPPAGVSWRRFMQGAENALADCLIKHAPILGSKNIDTALARAFVLAKHARTSEARRQLELVRAEAQSSGKRDVDNEFVLVDTHVRVYEDQPLVLNADAVLKHVLETLPNDDPVGRALALNLLCIHSLHMGHFDRAQEYAERAIRLYQQGGAEFGSLHVHAHLGQIKLMRGDLEGAAAQYAEMEERLGRLRDDTTALLAVCRALRSEVAYETNDLAHSAALLADAIGSVEDDDAWLDVRAAAYRVRARLAYVRSDLPGALTELAHCENMAASRNMPRLYRLMQIERMRMLTLSGELEAARQLMQGIGLTWDPRDWETGEDWALRQGTTGVAIARWLVRARRSPDALAFIEPAEDFAIRGGQLLSLAKFRVIRAAAHWRLNQKTDATGSLLSALRLLGRQPFRRFILDEGSEVRSIVQAALDGTHLTIQPSLEGRRKLSELTHYWATRDDTNSGTEFGDASNRSSSANHRIRCLQLIAFGHSNKAIGQILGVSTNTVKYHLKILFNDLNVSNRLQAVRRGRELGII